MYCIDLHPNVVVWIFGIPKCSLSVHCMNYSFDIYLSF